VPKLVLSVAARSTKVVLHFPPKLKLEEFKIQLERLTMSPEELTTRTDINLLPHDGSHEVVIDCQGRAGIYTLLIANASVKLCMVEFTPLAEIDLTKIVFSPWQIVNYHNAKSNQRVVQENFLVKTMDMPTPAKRKRYGAQLEYFSEEETTYSPMYVIEPGRVFHFRKSSILDWSNFSATCSYRVILHDQYWNLLSLKKSKIDQLNASSIFSAALATKSSGVDQAEHLPPFHCTVTLIPEIRSTYEQETVHHFYTRRTNLPRKGVYILAIQITLPSSVILASEIDDLVLTVYCSNSHTEDAASHSDQNTSSTAATPPSQSAWRPLIQQEVSLKPVQFIQVVNRFRHGTCSATSTTITVSRNRILESVLKASKHALLSKCSFRFSGENGYDAGGLTREFFDLLGKEIDRGVRGMWMFDQMWDEVICPAPPQSKENTPHCGISESKESCMELDIKISGEASGQAGDCQVRACW
jgi:hypothetical protein